MNPAIICFGQQPNGFFPKRYLYAKITTAKKLQAEIGGRIVFFYHDSDADYRETITILHDKMTGAEVRLNFTQENKLQKKYSPLYAKRIPLTPTLSPKGRGGNGAGWKEKILKQLPRFVEKPMIDMFASIDANSAADFCLQMYKKMGLLEGIEIVRSSNKEFRQAAIDLCGGYYVDADYEGEIVRAKIRIDDSQPSRLQSPEAPADGGQATLNPQSSLILHEGGGKFTEIPAPAKIDKRQKSPGASERFKWMQSVIRSTHYIYGEGEKEYLDFDAHQDVKFIEREHINNPNLAYIPNL